MGFAEKKIELYKIVAEADEETTAKLINFTKACTNKIISLQMKKLRNMKDAAKSF